MNVYPLSKAQLSGKSLQDCENNDNCSLYLVYRAKSQCKEHTKKALDAQRSQGNHEFIIRAANYLKKYHAWGINIIKVKH